MAVYIAFYKLRSFIQIENYLKFYKKRYIISNRGVKMAIELLDKIVSMIIQNLRLSKHTKLIEIIKKSEYAMEWRDHDNWNGGIDYYDLVFYLDFDEYCVIYDEKETYQEIMEKSLNSFYNDESNIIRRVVFVAKIESFVDWEALDATENKNTIIRKVNREKEILIKIGTGILKIQDVNEKYKSEHQHLNSLLKKICLSNPNTYEDLWDWYNDYTEKKLSTYQSRRIYVNNLYSEIINILVKSKVQDNSIVSYVPIGWEKVDDAIIKMKEILVSASLTEDYQSVGMYGREVLITLAQLVFNKDKHPSVDGIDIGKADSKRMLEAYINACLKHRKNPRELKFAKSAIDFSNELTHNRTATAIDSELCYSAVATTVNIIRIINRYN